MSILLIAHNAAAMMMNVAGFFKLLSCEIIHAATAMNEVIYIMFKIVDRRGGTFVMSG